ncbi:hypothetical protein [Clostridium grantii]|uniref:Uncharacterized protein n=1 Tax=Clostridium grantii DSM 8605 TaxID=1121316 RepID=A0A1M5XRN1_9CLOT|nr:hypothetical protein [Clostridium grantii]SHI02198.1 hypothetical protein SAMN02745207_03863 [Clostridium grantii DSM 8605]
MISLYKSFSYENTCVSIINEEVESFFDIRLNEAYTYTMLLVKNTKAYNKDDFKSNVISNLDIQLLFIHIFERIGTEIFESLDFDSTILAPSTLPFDHIIKQSSFDSAILEMCNYLSDDIITTAFNSIGHEVFEIELNKATNKKIKLDKHQESIYSKISETILSFKLQFKDSLKNITIQTPKHIDSSNTTKYIM